MLVKQKQVTLYCSVSVKEGKAALRSLNLKKTLSILKPKTAEAKSFGFHHCSLTITDTLTLVPLFVLLSMDSSPSIVSALPLMLVNPKLRFS